MKSGHVALIGRPNVGKSTLLNHLLGQKISITSRKPQTTRHRILGIHTSESGQIIYLDTPGIHKIEKKLLNKHLNKIASSALLDIEVIVWLIDNIFWHKHDSLILDKLKSIQSPVILAVNKVDKIKNKEAMLGFFAEAQKQFKFSEIIPISALLSINLKLLQKLILNLLSERDLIYPADQITNCTERFLIAEIIREKLTRRLGAELPYSLAVEIEQYKEQATISKIYAIIWVERNSQKSIVIGKQGAMLKKIGQDARINIENLIKQKVYLQLWVKVKKGWSNNEQALKSLGIASKI